MVNQTDMPTKLIRRDPDKPLLVVRRSSYTKLLKKYQKLLNTSDSMEELIQELEETIQFYEHELYDQKDERVRQYKEPAYSYSNPDEDEPGTLKLNFTPDKGFEVGGLEKKKKRTKFAGATLEFNPFKKTLGIGFHFKDTD